MTALGNPNDNAIGVHMLILAWQTLSAHLQTSREHEPALTVEGLSKYVLFSLVVAPQPRET